LKQMGYTGNF